MGSSPLLDVECQSCGSLGKREGGKDTTQSVPAGNPAKSRAICLVSSLFHYIARCATPSECFLLFTSCPPYLLQATGLWFVFPSGIGTAAKRWRCDGEGFKGERWMQARRIGQDENQSLTTCVASPSSIDYTHH